MLLAAAVAAAGVDAVVDADVLVPLPPLIILALAGR